MPYDKDGMGGPSCLTMVSLVGGGIKIFALLLIKLIFQRLIARRKKKKKGAKNFEISAFSSRKFTFIFPNCDPSPSAVAIASYATPCRRAWNKNISADWRHGHERQD